MKKITDYKGFKPNILLYVKDIPDGESTLFLKTYIAKLTLKLLEDYNLKKLSKEEVSEVFLLLQLYLNDNFPELDKDPSIYDLLYDGTVFHSSHADYGERVKNIKQIANKIIKDQG